MVRFLCSFINNRRWCPSGMERVNIQEEINEYKSKNPGRTPTIVFDFCGALSIFIKSDHDIFSGGRLNLCEKRVENFLQKLKNMGTNLVFFDDGPVKEEKLLFCLKKADIKYEKQCKIFDSLRQSGQVDMPMNLRTSFCLYEVFLRIAKKYGEHFQSFHNECDRDCAAYATKIEAAAVMTLDSDFLIMPGDWPIWIPHTFDIESNMINVWNKKALRNALGLMQSQMPIFSILSGNDWTHPERFNFHWISDLRDRQQSTADFIRRHFPKGVPLSRELFLQLVGFIYNKGQNSFTMEEAEEIVDTSLRFYRYEDHHTQEISPQWLKKHSEDTSSNYVYTLVKKLPLIVRQTFIDLSLCNVRPYSYLALPILRKQMGITDYHNNRKEIERIVYLKPSHQVPFQKQKTTPIFPDFDIPPLNILLGCDATEEENANLADKRLEIFCWSISVGTHQVKPEVFKTVENQAYIPSILVLAYLVEELQISCEEADVMLLSINESMNASYEKLESFSPPELYDQRGVWLAHVFLRLRQIYFDSFLLCGLNEYRQYDSYDGFIFHKMFRKYQLLDSETKRSLRKPIEGYRIYANHMP